MDTFSYFIYYFFAQGQYYGDGKDKERRQVTFKQNLFYVRLNLPKLHSLCSCISNIVNVTIVPYTCRKHS